MDYLVVLPLFILIVFIVVFLRVRKNGYGKVKHPPTAAEYLIGLVSLMLLMAWGSYFVAMIGGWEEPLRLGNDLEVWIGPTAWYIFMLLGPFVFLGVLAFLAARRLARRRAR